MGDKITHILYISSRVYSANSSMKTLLNVSSTDFNIL